MRIGFIATEFVTEPNFAGGFSNYLYRLGLSLTKRGHEVHVITASQHNGRLVYDGIHIHRIASSHWSNRLNRLLRWKTPLTSRWLDFSYNAYRCLRKLHAETPFDILQFPNLQGCGLFCSFLLRVPYVVRISSYAPTWNKLQGREKILDYKLIELLELIQLRKASNIFAPSITLKRFLEKELGIKNIHIGLTPFYIETEKFDNSIYTEHLTNKPFLLFFAGRLAAHKGPQVLAKALPGIFQHYPDLMAVFVGKDVLQDNRSMRCYIQTLCEGFQDRLLFFDPLSHEQLYPLIQHAEVIALPSLVDNLPNACLEAMGLGAVVIGTKGASFEELITDGVNGFLVEANNVEHLREIISQVLSLEDKQLIAHSAQQTTKKFSPEKTVADLEDYYSSIINNYH